MKIINTSQYNQGIGKYKLLSSTAGVGSIITSKFGNYILISDIFNWKFVKKANDSIKSENGKTGNQDFLYENSQIELNKIGVEIVDDKRFVCFIKNEQGLVNLVCLIDVPNMSLNESFNTANWENHPIKVKLNLEVGAQDYMVSGTHFPKWFKDSKGNLKKIKEWKDQWNAKRIQNGNGLPSINHFAPPRNINKQLGSSYNIRMNREGAMQEYTEYEVLQQNNLILICPNGHLSDIPWPKYLRWKTEKIHSGHNLIENNNAEELFNMDDCCANPRLKMSENQATSEGYGSIYIECLGCGLGSGADKQPKINLEGINSIEPKCRGQKPWEIDLMDSTDFIPFDTRCVDLGSSDPKKEISKMKISLVTANNVYYATGFSSLYVPLNWSSNISDNMSAILERINIKYNNYLDRKPETTKVEFWNKKMDIDDLEDIIFENGFKKDEQIDVLYKTAKEHFFSEVESVGDSQLEYKYQEYRTFINYSKSPDNEKEPLSFEDIVIPGELSSYFTKIQQIEELAVTNVQFEFTRVKPNERIVSQSKDEFVIQNTAKGMKIFSKSPGDVLCLPANQSRGEGIFIQFNEDSIEKWMSDYSDLLDDRFIHFMNREISEKEQGAALKNKIKNNGLKQFLVHSFSHLLMRELEFSCGYPTASLKERLYISSIEGREMAGLLIYTAEGSEGSMGGLMSQAAPDRILSIIKKGLERADNCSSDPLCWEHDGQGIYNLNLAACFSCALVAETACEEMNLSLDRRILVDEEFGYFKNLM